MEMGSVETPASSGGGGEVGGMMQVCSDPADSGEAAVETAGGLQEPVPQEMGAVAQSIEGGGEEVAAGQTEETSPQLEEQKTAAEIEHEEEW